MGFAESLALLAGISVYCVQRIRLGFKGQEMGSISLKQLTTSVMLSGSCFTDSKERRADTMLGWLRLSIGLLEAGLLFVRFYNGPVSRVCNDEVTACIPYGGVWVASTFTIWCWILQSLFFIASGLITLNKHHWGKPSKRLIFALWVSYEVSLCVAVLVVAAVWLVLIPVLDWKLANFSGSPEALAALKLRQLAMHQPFAVLVHTANLWFLLLEHSLNSLPFNNAHFPFVLLWGCTYAGFAWVWFNLTNIWYYFFLDYRRPTAVVAYMALMGSLTLFFWISSRATLAKPLLRIPLFYGSMLLSLFSLLYFSLQSMSTMGLMSAP